MIKLTITLFIRLLFITKNTFIDKNILPHILSSVMFPLLIFLSLAALILIYLFTSGFFIFFAFFSLSLMGLISTSSLHTSNDMGVQCDHVALLFWER